MANVIVFGDSIAFGFYDNKGGWVTRLITHFSNIEPPEKEFHTKIYNMAVAGATSTDILNQIDTVLEYRSWENEQTIIIFQIGVNDSGLEGSDPEPRTDVTTFESNLRNIISKSKKISADVIFLGLIKVDETKTTPVPWNDKLKYTNDQIAKYDQIIQKVTSSAEVEYLQLTDMFSSKSDLLTDGLHLSEVGHELLFTKMLKIVNKMIDNNSPNKSIHG